MDNTKKITYVFIIFCDKPYEAALKKLFEVNTDLKKNLVLLVGSPRRRQEVSATIQFISPEMSYDDSLNGFEAFTYLQAAYRRAFGNCYVAAICTPQYGARLMQVARIIELKKYSLADLKEDVEFMFFSINEKDRTSAFVTKHFYSSQKGIMTAKKWATWLLASYFRRQCKRMLDESRKRYRQKGMYSPSDFSGGFFKSQKKPTVICWFLTILKYFF